MPTARIYCDILVVEGMTAKSTYNISTTTITTTDDRLSLQNVIIVASPLVSALYPADQNNITAFTALTSTILFLQSISIAAVSYHLHRVYFGAQRQPRQQSTYCSTRILIVTLRRYPPDDLPPSLRYYLKRARVGEGPKSVCCGPLVHATNIEVEDLFHTGRAFGVVGSFFAFVVSKRREEEQRERGGLGGGGSIGTYNLYIHLHTLI